MYQPSKNRIFGRYKGLMFIFFFNSFSTITSAALFIASIFNGVTSLSQNLPNLAPYFHLFYILMLYIFFLSAKLLYVLLCPSQDIMSSRSYSMLAISMSIGPRNTYFLTCRPGHGAPTTDIRKKKFTEHQLDNQLHQARNYNLFFTR